MTEMILEHEAAARKASLHEEPLLVQQQWLFENFATTQAALDFLNAPFAQGPGEVSATARNDGTVGLFWFG